MGRSPFSLGQLECDVGQVVGKAFQGQLVSFNGVIFPNDLFTLVSRVEDRAQREFEKRVAVVTVSFFPAAFPASAVPGGTRPADPGFLPRIGGTARPSPTHSGAASLRVIS